MPTIGIYVPINIARRVAARWQIDVNGEEFSELVRGICYASLADEATFELGSIGLDAKCDYVKFHQLGRYCRHCGGH